MKKLQFWCVLASFLCALVLSSCSKDDDEPQVVPSIENIKGVWALDEYRIVHGASENYAPDFVRTFTAEKENRQRWEFTEKGAYYHWYEDLEPYDIVKKNGIWGAPDNGIGYYRLNGDTIRVVCKYLLSNGKPTAYYGRYKILKLTDTTMKLTSVRNRKDSDRRFFYSLTRVKE